MWHEPPSERGNDFRPYETIEGSKCGGTNIGQHNFKHGLANTPMHRIWQSMRSRCNSPTSKKYPDYGGRGIFICTRWEDFLNFLADMGERPTSSHQLDRIDNDGPYSPENCRWATPKEQMNNTRKVRFIDLNGERLTLTQWSKRLGIPKATLASRIRKTSDAAKILLTPVQTRRHAA